MHLQECYNLKKHNSFGFNAVARYWLAASNKREIREALQFAEQHELPLMVLGEGSNLVLADDFPGLALKVCITGRQVVEDDGDRVRVRVGAGENWHALVQWTLAQGYYGLENLSLIPGSVGAAPVQNIGAYGVELCQLFYQLSAIDRKTGAELEFGLEACQFGYRDSVFKKRLKDTCIITAVELNLSRRPNIDIRYASLAAELKTVPENQRQPKLVSAAVCKIRQRKLPDPLVLGNAGSFFKNPWIEPELFDDLQEKYPDIALLSREGGRIKVSAAWMIEKCGWKGYRSGNVGVHGQQALVLVNYGGGCGKELLVFAEKIRASVKMKFRVELEAEPRVYPCFSSVGC